MLPQYWDLLPAHSLQQLPLISHFKHYLIYVLAQPVVHILHFFFFNSIFVCQRYVNLSESADRERKKGMEGFQLPDRK